MFYVDQVSRSSRGVYTREETTCVKIKNRAYSQAIGREDLFDAKAARA